MSQSQYQAALDLGSSVITTVVGAADQYGGLHISGVGRAPSAGISAGQVSNVSRAATAIRQSLDQAEAASGMAITQVGVCVTGTHFESRNNRGAIALSYDEPISWEDMLRAEESGKAVTIRPGTELVHAIPRYFVVDAERRCDDPRGQHGQRLDVDTHVVTGATNAIQNAAACVVKAGVEISLVAAKPVVGAVRAVSDEERQRGTLVIGMDADTTTLAAFEDGAISHTSVLGIGSSHIVRDLGHGLQCSAADALEIMHQYGLAHPLLARGDQAPISLRSFSGDIASKSAAEIAELIYPRLNEIITMVGQSVTEHQLQLAASRGIVVTGGGGLLRGVDQVIGRAFSAPARIGSIGQLSGLSDQLNRPDAIGAVGMLEWLAHGVVQTERPRRPAGNDTSLLTTLSAGVSNIARVFSPHG